MSAERVREGPGFRLGALVGLLLTSILTVALYIGQQLAALPFLPFGLFDALVRLLPGGLLTRGIDTLVGVIEALGVGPTSEVAKRVEQTAAVAGFLAVGALLGGVFFTFVRFRDVRRPRVAGVALGAAAGVMLAAVGLSVADASGSGLVSAAWTVALVAPWGLALGASFERLSPERPGPEPDVGARAAAAVEPVDRRTFLVRLGAATALITVAGAVVGRASGRGGARQAALAGGARPWSDENPLPNATSGVTPVRGTRLELTPVPRHYRIDINTLPPYVEGESWRLRVGGLVQRPLALTLDDLRAYEPVHQFVTLECISNRVGGDLIGTTRWTGVSLSRVLEDSGLGPSATHLRIRSADGFHEVVDVETAKSDPRVMLCYDWDGLPLPVEHGFPLRVYVPDRFGMKQPKWIESIDAVDAWEAGYWVGRGWDREALVEATAVIDTVATDMMMPERTSAGSVPVGGIAYAGARGISRVEVRVDGGGWTTAELRDPLSDTTWVLWRYDWPFSPGAHTLNVRCFDGRGAPQEEVRSPPHPDGATGFHAMEVMI